VTVWYAGLGVPPKPAYISILIPLASSQHNLYDIYLVLCIQYWTPDDGQKTYPKHAEFYSKNKFEKLVHLVGFIIRRILLLTLLNDVFPSPYIM